MAHHVRGELPGGPEQGVVGHDPFMRGFSRSSLQALGVLGLIPPSCLRLRW